MRARILGLIGTPLLAYPFLAGSLLLVDAFVGEHLLSHYVRHEQRLLWDTFWSDYVDATPVMYVGIGAVVGLFLVMRRFSSRLAPVGLVLMLAGAGWAVAAYLTRSWIGPAHLAMAVSGALVGVPVTMSLEGVLRRRPGGRPG